MNSINSLNSCFMMHFESSAYQRILTVRSGAKIVVGCSIFALEVQELRLLTFIFSWLSPATVQSYKHAPC